MQQLRRAAGSAALLAAVFASATSVAQAIPPDPTDPPIRCPRGYILVDGECVKPTPPPPPPPPPPSISPKVTVDLARQTTDQTAVHVVGWTSDAELPATPLTVRISVDGTIVREVTANRPRPDVGLHGYDETVPAANAQQVCVTALNVGPTGHATAACQSVDNVVEFQARDITYDIAHLQITSAGPVSLDTVTNTNSTTVQQSTTISGSEEVEESHSWETEKELKVSASASFKIPFISSASVSVEGHMTWKQGGTTTTTHTFSWEQPVLVPAKSKVVATVGVTKTAFNVPFTLTGDYLYESGFLAPGTNGGMFTGVNGHDLDVTLKQYNLDGTPAAVPVAQPAATLLNG